jgi:hypothetical protein
MADRPGDGRRCSLPAIKTSLMQFTKSVVPQVASLAMEPAASGLGSPATCLGYKAEVLPLAVCMAVGLTMSLLPALIQWFKVGYMIWIGNGDELFMLALGSQAYFNHPAHLSDPVFVSGGTSLFRQLPLLPGVWMAWVLDSGPGGIDVCWRIISGVSLGITWYLVIRQAVPNRWIAAAATSILLADCGLLGCGIVFRQVQAFARMLSQSPRLIEGAFLHAEWRVATPALTMPYLLLHLWLVTRARQAATWMRLVLAGVSFGLLFHVYPYFWTAACVALAVAFLIDRGHRRVYFWTAVFGGLIGAFRISWDVMLKRGTAPDWLVRSDKFVAVLRFADLKPPIVATLVLVLGLFWIWRRRRDLIYLWTMGFCGCVLFKSHVVTGIDIENYHWLYVWAPCCSLLLLLMIVSVLPLFGERTRFALLSLMVISTLDVAMGLALRAAEAVQAKEGLALVQNWADYEVQRIDSGAQRLLPNATVAGERQFIDFATILENQRPLVNYWVYLSPQISDQEWYRRIAVNAYLLGQDRAAFEAAERDAFRPRAGKGGWGPWTRDAADAGRRISGLLSAYDDIVQDPEAVLNLFHVHYVGLRSGLAPPKSLAPEKWTLLQDGPVWQVWERL